MAGYIGKSDRLSTSLNRKRRLRPRYFKNEERVSRKWHCGQKMTRAPVWDIFGTCDYEIEGKQVYTVHICNGCGELFFEFVRDENETNKYKRNQVGGQRYPQNQSSSSQRFTGHHTKYVGGLARK